MYFVFMDKNFIPISQTSSFLLVQSGRALALLSDAIGKGDAIEGLEGFESPKSHIIFSERQGMYPANAKGITLELLGAMIEGGLLAVKEGAVNPCEDRAVKIYKPAPIAWVYPHKDAPEMLLQ